MLLSRLLLIGGLEAKLPYPRVFSKHHAVAVLISFREFLPVVVSVVSGATGSRWPLTRCAIWRLRASEAIGVCISRLVPNTKFLAMSARHMFRRRCAVRITASG